MMRTAMKTPGALPLKSLTGALLAGAVAFGATSANAITLTSTTDANILAGAILGGGITISGATFTGASGQAGTFSGGTNPVGFASGIALTSGSVGLIPGPNTTGTETQGSFTGGADFSVSHGGAGDAALSALVGGSSTFDAAILEFDFTFDGGAGGDLFFNFVFGSEEYINYVGSTFNDAFALFVNGVNIALLDSCGAAAGTAVTVNNVNGSTNSACYRNNVPNTNGFPNLMLDTRVDGLTTVLTAQSLGLDSSTHHMKIAIADTTDEAFDSVVFIQGSSFSNTPTPPTPMTGVPEPATLALFGLGLLGLGYARKRQNPRASSGRTPA